jgi:hypothetical protein
VYLARTGANAVPGDPGGPAVRERVWAYAQDRDRNKVRALEEQMAKVIKGLEANEYAVALLNQEATDDRNNVEAISASLTSLRSERASPPTNTGGGGRQLTGERGFDKLTSYKGAAPEWKVWRFKLTNWLSQFSPSYETLLVKLDYSEIEPVESTDGLSIRAGESEITLEEEWCADQLYHLLVQKCEGPALDIIMNQNRKGKARGLIAWFRTLREAEGQVTAKRSEITEKVYQSDRKSAAIKDVVSTLEAYENEVREYKILTGNTVEDSIKVLNLKKMVPEVIRERLETHDVQTYAEAKEYALKQVRNLKKTSKTHQLDLNEEEGEKENKPEGEEEEYSKEDLLAWLGKGPGKGGSKGANPKGGKGKEGKWGLPRKLPLLWHLGPSPQ